jgi:biopolymer transport protein ExbB/TolQ
MAMATVSPVSQDGGVAHLRRWLGTDDPLAEDHRGARTDDAPGVSVVSGIERAFAFKYLLLLRFALVNLAGFALLGAAYMQGWIGIAHRADTTYQSHVIFGVFLVGLAICGQKVWRTSRELNLAKRFDPFRPEPSLALRYVAQIKGRPGESRALAASALKLKLSSRTGVVRFTANLVVLLGLIGTVVGFIMALGGVDPEAGGDASAIGPMVSTLIKGMSVALYTTLVGAVLNIWLMINYQMLSSATVSLATAIVEVGEAHGRT